VILRTKLPTLDKDNAKRIAIAKQYSTALSKYVSAPVVKPERTSVFHQYVICTSDQQRLADFLRSRGIGTAVHYPAPIHLQPAYLGRLGNPGDFPVAEYASTHLLSLPIYPELGAQEVARIIDSIQRYLEKNGKRNSRARTAWRPA
jgi:dTDP-4-amino-4,6-dideoxygalactose transaminase